MSQSLSIFNDNHNIIFNEESVFEIVLSKTFDDKGVPCCKIYNLVGKFSKIDQDSFDIKLNTYNFFESIDGVNYEKEIFSREFGYKSIFAKKDLHSITQYTSLHNMNRKDNFNVLGGILVLTGLSTALNSLFLAKGNKNSFYLAGGIQIGAGISFLLLSKSKTYKFNRDHNPWNLDKIINN